MKKLIFIFFVVFLSIFFFTRILGNKANRDTQRKKDLQEIQAALEVFKRQNGSYPLSTNNDKTEPYRLRGFQIDTPIIDWGSSWAPYLAKMPKDPSSNRRYVYFASQDGQAYWLYASLEDENDKDMCNNGKACTGLSGNGILPLACGQICNYGVSSSNVSP